jgi:hypothetical protein
MINWLEKYESGESVENENGISITKNLFSDNPDPNETLIQIKLSGTLPYSINIGDSHPSISDAKVSEIHARQWSENKSLVTVIYKTDEIYPSENEWGETWEWELASSQSHINSVDDPDKQTNYGVDVGVAIGVNGENIDGVEVYRPVMQLKVTKHVTDSSLYAARSNIRDQLATVNSHAWKGFDPGEALFIGTQIRKNKLDDWLFEYHFLIGKIQITPAITLADGSTVGPLTLYPWQYVWFQHQNLVLDGDLKRLIKSVHITNVYESSSFANFGLKGS